MTASVARLRHRVRGPVVARRHRGLRTNDAVVASYPRSGNTWLTFLLVHLARGDADFDVVQSSAPGVGAHQHAPGLLRGGGRLLRTHEPFRSEYRRGVYVVRDVRDVVVSYFEYQRMMRRYTGSIEDFARLFLKGRADGYGPWPAHVESWLSAPVPVHVVRYEELRRDTASGLRGVADFLGLDVDDAAIASAVEANELGRMQEKEQQAKDRWFAGTASSSRFVRSGGSGEWRERLSDDARRAIEQACAPMLLRLGYPVGAA